MKLIFHWLVSSIAILIAAYLIPRVEVDSFVTALIVAVVIGALNMLVRPILLLLTFPITIVTLGLFTLVINAALVWLTQMVVPGFTVGNFGWAILFAVVLSVINLVFKQMNSRDTERPTFRVNN
ncbi:MAG TPA: phage holin family protein [Candidatus Doudnabacteria bacterium]|mgnify:CR=1 FL=1|nr:phage holin family protein [Candidatus Doudnabacteria bacterium]